MKKEFYEKLDTFMVSEDGVKEITYNDKIVKVKTYSKKVFTYPVDFVFEAMEVEDDFNS